MREIERRLASRLAGALPGVEAQFRLAPRPRRGWSPGVVPEGCRDGAALALLYPLARVPRLLLTLRDGGLPHHAGQVALPGGALEPGESIEQGALREAAEEVGLDPRAVRLLGRLTPLHIPVSRFVLHTVVGVAARRPALDPCRREVERLLEPALAALADPAAYRVESRTFEGRAYEVPYLPLDGAKLWGATAMVVAELLAILGLEPDPWAQRRP